jgi:geranylgeranyl diphosphate synthase type II
MSYSMKISLLDRSAEGDLKTLREALRTGFDDVAGGEARLEASLTHILAHPGNLGRAKVCLAVGRVVGLPQEEALALAMGVEYFHTASLVFDDLPCMDDAHERRQVPCVHRLYGDSAAVLSGLALVNRAYRLIWQAMAGAEIEDRLRSSDYVDRCLGVFGLLGGQSRDLHDPSALETAEGVMDVARMKTVPLLQMAIVLPVMLTGGSERLIQLLERYCVLRGLAYQIADDLKDVTAGSEEVGKTTGRDEALGRPNLVSAIGVEGARVRLARLNRLGDRVLDQLPGGTAQWSLLNALRPKDVMMNQPNEQQMASAVV